MKVYVSGCAGFIGSNVCRVLQDAGHEVRGQDSLTDYYSPALKRFRLSSITRPGFEYHPQDILTYLDLTDIDIVIHLAGQPGVRGSLLKSALHIQNNIAATTRVLDAAMRAGVPRVVFASSSSVYGLDSLYAASKASCELIASQYSDQFDAVIGCRIFPTYGPYGRPDMAPWKIATAMLRDEPVFVTGDGSQQRDYTFINDTATYIVRLAMEGEGGVHDVGRGCLRSVNELLYIIQSLTGKDADVRYVAKPHEETDNVFAARSCGKVDLEEGIPALLASVEEWIDRERRAA